MTASWADDKNMDIKVDLTTTFNYDRFGSFPYGVAFVLSENGMTGKGATWKQLNYFSKLAGVMVQAISTILIWLHGSRQVLMLQQPTTML